MEVEDAENMVSVSSTMIRNSIGSQQNQALSAEDLAWVESCLNNDFDISDSNWIPMKKALLEIINSQTQPWSNVEEDIDILLSSEEAQIDSIDQEFLTCYDSYAPSTIPINIAARLSADENLDDEINVPSSTLQGNPFLPSYNEDLKKSEATDFGLNVDFSFHEVEQTPETIFKIWDLDIPSEEGELVRQLDKALKESLSTSLDDSVDDLIAGVADLSLNQIV